MRASTTTNYFYSCVVDSSAIFYYQTWGWVQSLINVATVRPSQIYVHYTKEVDEAFIKELINLGVNAIQITRFGDGKFCNKIAQLDTKIFESAECVFLMDTDMFALCDLSNLYRPNMICGKVVDRPNPDISTLKSIFKLAGFNNHPVIRNVDRGSEQTFYSNLNGGLYVIPGNLFPTLRVSWKKWALWLLENIKILQNVGKQSHVDQLSFSLATFDLSIPIQNIERKYNYPAHFNMEHTGYPAVLHYHRKISNDGLIEVDGECDKEFHSAIQTANDILSNNFNNKLFRATKKGLRYRP